MDYVRCVIVIKYGYSQSTDESLLIHLELKNRGLFLFTRHLILHLLTQLLFLSCPLDGAGTLQWQGGSTSKPGKPKHKKNRNPRQKFDVSIHTHINHCSRNLAETFHWFKCQKSITGHTHIMWVFVCIFLPAQHRFQPQNPLSGAQPFSPREVGGEEEELRLSAHTLLLPTRGQLEARMMVTAFELGLDNITDDAVSTMVYAVEVCGSCAPTLFWLNLLKFSHTSLSTNLAEKASHRMEYNAVCQSMSKT